jgi:hypothetical protein
MTIAGDIGQDPELVWTWFSCQESIPDPPVLSKSLYWATRSLRREYHNYRLSQSFAVVFRIWIFFFISIFPLINRYRTLFITRSMYFESLFIILQYFIFPSYLKTEKKLNWNHLALTFAAIVLVMLHSDRMECRISFVCGRKRNSPTFTALTSVVKVV